jgi:hypothetical protein
VLLVLIDLALVLLSPHPFVVVVVLGLSSDPADSSPHPVLVNGV